LSSLGKREFFSILLDHGGQGAGVGDQVSGKKKEEERRGKGEADES
jgi:hypothetical protein